MNSGSNISVSAFVQSIDGTGYDDTLSGGASDDSLDGGPGNDSLDGGPGNDWVSGGEGNDWVYGNGGNDTVNGDGGDDLLGGGPGNDWVSGGEGNDRVFEYDGNDTVNGDGGDDSLDGSLGNDVLDGGAGNDSLLGGPGDDILNGGSGNDSLDVGVDGGPGNDTLSGGTGDDTYYVGSVNDLVIEEVGEGTDTVLTILGNYTLADNVENLVFIATSGFSGTGNSLDNRLTGNQAKDTLAGLGGNDTLVGGAGDDTYIVDDAGDQVEEQVDEGIDIVKASITYTLASNVEKLELIGDNSINGTGNALDNILYGNSGNNILDGGLGGDVMIGGAGNDTYVVDSYADNVTEFEDEGIDTVQVGFSYTLRNHFENLTLTGAGNINGVGNALDNILTGNSGSNILSGSDGNDTLIGGAGNDTYVVESATDEVRESEGEGIDTVQAGISYTLGDNLENLTVTWSDGSIDGTGNALGNTLTGSIGDNTLSGLEGNDTLDGGWGNDTLIGGTGNDRLIGGLNNDWLTGGSGADQFVFNLRQFNVDATLRPAEYFDQWLKSNGLSLKKLTTVDVFNAKYEGWLDYLVIKHQFGHDLNNDDTISISRLASSSASLPDIEGLTLGQIDDLFDAARSITFNGRTKTTVSYSNQFNAPPALTLTSQDGQDVITDFVRGEDKLVLEVSGTFYRDPQSAVTIETGQFFGGDGSGLDTRIGLTTDAFWSVVLSGVTGITASDIDWVFTP